MQTLKALLVLTLGAAAVACSSGGDSSGGTSGSTSAAGQTSANPGGTSSGGTQNSGAGSGSPGSVGGTGSAQAGSTGVSGVATGGTNSGGMSTGGTNSGGASTGGTNSGGASTGGMSAGGTSSAGAGGTATVTPYVPAWSCLVPTWPTPTGSAVSISSTMSVSGTYDGKMALHNGSGSGDFVKDCSASGTAGQGTTKPLFELEDGATIQNVIVGNHGADGIHCKGTCTIKNVWFQYVCDDAATAESGSSGTVTIDGGGAKNAHDKLFQDNSHGKFIIQNFYGERLGKMYRACGVGGACDTTKGNVTVTNVTAVGVDQIVGVTQGRDKATLSKICTFQTPTICDIYDSSDNAITDGPDGTTCTYKWTDIQVMVNRVGGVFATASECPNYLTSGSTTNAATMCIADLGPCIKNCLPGDNGLKMCDCTGTANAYKCHGCSLPIQDPAKTAFAPATAMAAPDCASDVTKNKACTTEWQICKSGTQYCSCVFKPGYLQTANTVWDCVNQWW